MSRLRLVPYRKLRRIAEAGGFQLVHRAGSHCSFRNAEGRIVVIPDHGSKVIIRPLLRSIIRGLGIDVDEYNRLPDEL